MVSRCSPNPIKQAADSGPWGKIAAAFSSIANPECHWYFDH